MGGLIGVLLGLSCIAIYDYAVDVIDLMCK